jgi:solute carrier family 25 protein 16
MPTNLIRHDDLGISTNIMSNSAAHAQTNASPSLERHPPTWATDGDPMHLRKDGVPNEDMAMQDGKRMKKKKVDKKSPEYLWKSMLAGGIAGCAVSTSTRASRM